MTLALRTVITGRLDEGTKMMTSTAHATTAKPMPAFGPGMDGRVQQFSRGSPAAIRDRIDLSDAAKAELSEQPMRTELIRDIRRQIADGTYLTDEKLDAVVNRLHRELFE